jgi:hypothetical protein
MSKIDIALTFAETGQVGQDRKVSQELKIHYSIAQHVQVPGFNPQHCKKKKNKKRVTRVTIRYHKCIMLVRGVEGTSLLLENKAEQKSGSERLAEENNTYIEISTFRRVTVQTKRMWYILGPGRSSVRLDVECASPLRGD